MRKNNIYSASNNKMLQKMHSVKNNKYGCCSGSNKLLENKSLVCFLNQTSGYNSGF